MNGSIRRYSKKRTGPFGKVGRPANDRVRERLRIYRSAGPLILERGVRGTTIRAVARASHLSPGGIYHYFDSKRALVLYGLEPEALSRACAEEASELYEAVSGGSDVPVSAVVQLYIDKNVRMLDFVRPALHAAVELGRPQLRDRLSAGLREDADWLVSAVRMLHPGAMAAEESAGLIRRTILGLAIDEGVTTSQVREQLSWLFHRLVPGLPRSGSS